MSEKDFSSFEQVDWVSFAWHTLDYAEDDVTIEQVRRGDATLDDLEVGREVHTYDSRFADLDGESELDMDNPRHFLFELYSLKNFIETSPHPENTNVRRLGSYLERVYDEFGVEPEGVESGELIDKFEEKYPEKF